MNKLNILYEDNHIIVLEKPINVLVQGDNTGDITLSDMLKEYLKVKYNKDGNVYLGVIHRLDRPVGGLMVFARTSKAAERLTNSIKNHEFKKNYLCVTKGNMKEKDTLINYIDRVNKKSIITKEGKGKYAELSYEILEKKKNLNLLKIDLVTGRHHQIRVQLANIHHPLYGDQLYGIQDKKQIALFAYHLEFVHPVTKEHMSFNLCPKGEIWKSFDYINNWSLS